VHDQDITTAARRRARHSRRPTRTREPRQAGATPRGPFPAHVTPERTRNAPHTHPAYRRRRSAAELLADALRGGIEPNPGPIAIQGGPGLTTDNANGQDDTDTGNSTSNAGNDNTATPMALTAISVNARSLSATRADDLIGLHQDIIMVQEVWEGTDAAAHLHAAGYFVKMSPPNANGRGRVLIATKLPSEMWDPPPCRHAEVVGLRIGGIHFVSIYIEPTMDLAAVPDLHTWWQALPPFVCVAGDFNARHPSWCAQAQLSRPNSMTKKRADAVIASTASIRAPDAPSMPRQGTTPDLVLHDTVTLMTPVQLLSWSSTEHGSDHDILSFTVAPAGFTQLPAVGLQGNARRLRRTQITDEHRKAFRERLDKEMRTYFYATTERQLRERHAFFVAKIWTAARATLPTSSAAQLERQINRHAVASRRETPAEVRKAIRERLQDVHPATAAAILRGERHVHTPKPASAPTMSQFLKAYEEKHRDPAIPPEPPPPEPPPEPPPRRTEPVPDVTMEEIRAAVEHRQDAASDNDHIPPWLLRMLTDKALDYLRRMFSDVLRSGLVPSQWKRSNVSPLLKKNKTGDQAADYRPVAITSLLSRSFERVVAMRLRRTIASLDTSQHAYRPGCSTTTALADILATLGPAIGVGREASHRDRNHPNYAARTQHRGTLVAVDFSDAFARISPAAARRAMTRLKVPTYIINVVTEWMSHRRLRVHLNKAMSEYIRVDRGVPQGSVLGPIVWLLVMDELLTDLRPTKLYAPLGNTGVAASISVAYADDLTLGAVADAAKTESVRSFLKKSLGVVERWADRHGIAVSSKTEAMALGAACAPKPAELEDIITPAGLRIPVKGGEREDENMPLHLKTLGVELNQPLNLNSRVRRMEYVLQTATAPLRQISSLLGVRAARTLYQSVFLSRALYGSELLGFQKQDSREPDWANEIPPTSKPRTLFHLGVRREVTAALETAHVKACRTILRAAKSAESTGVRHEAGFRSLRCTIAQRRNRWRAKNAARTNKQLRTADGKRVTLQHDDGSWPYESYAVTQRHVEFRTRPPGGFVKGAAERAAANEAQLELAGLRKGGEDGKGAKSDDTIILATDGSAAKDHARSAAIVFASDGRELGQRLRPQHDAACSFTTERGAGLQGFDLVKETIQADASIKRVVWVADTLSLLTRLETGPLKARDSATAAIWKQLDEIGRLGVSVLAIFVYSHVGTPYNAEADELAEGDDFTPGAPPELWWEDYAAQVNRALQEEYDQSNAGSAEAGRLRWLYAPRGPTLYKGPAYDHLVAQLRTGVSGRWGGYAHDGKGDVVCRLCGEAALRRGGEAIEHLFDCTSMTAKQLRQIHLGDKAGVSPVVLWDRPTEAAFYAAAMCNAANGDTAAGEDESDSASATSAAGDE